MDNSKANQEKKGSNLIPLSLNQSLWSSAKSTNSVSTTDGSSSKIDNAVNVQVVIRCRPLSEHEKRSKTPESISCDEHKREISITTNMANQRKDKSLVFDRVFNQKSQQKDLFEQVATPIVNEALKGYTCTIFAYGQSGTGKTYTMEGEGKIQKSGAFDNDVGVIPRSVQEIFNILEVQKYEYQMKVAYLELCNEELTDLLVDENSKSINLMEDGKGNVFVRGLKETSVKSSAEVYKLLEEGSKRKHTAETLLNEQRNRSHSIFSVTIQIKECLENGDQLFRCGKLNLVDLAGSENILRSGATEERAREVGETNKSLLTLGRVINAISDHSSHVPYRDSKLTRLLRDSLGGRTKTCLIATISPSICCLEETLNTLEYAHMPRT